MYLNSEIYIYIYIYIRVDKHVFLVSEPHIPRQNKGTTLLEPCTYKALCQVLSQGAIHWPPRPGIPSHLVEVSAYNLERSLVGPTEVALI